MVNIKKAPLGDVKKAFRNMMYNSAPEVNALTAKELEVFNNMKPELRESLQLFSPDDLTSNKIDEILDVIIKAE